MSRKLRVLMSAMLLAPPAALALGLGDIRPGSALNEPLSAEIDLVAATPEEIAALQVQLASRELFQRYGLDRPAYLDMLEFRVGRGQDGRSVLLVRSRESISEPFVSFLVDVSWPRGRLLREYTVLLDPPVFTPPMEEPAAAAIVAPRAETAAAPIPPPAPAEASAPPAAAAAGAPAFDGPSSYRVESGDTLYQIAGALTGGDRAATQRMMIALFRANPEAFNGNINILRAGAILRVPAADQVSAIGAGEAASEVSRQIAAWRAGGATPEQSRLRLVAPEEGAGAAAAAEPATETSVASQIDALQRDIEQQRRLLELKNEELAELQRQMARAQAAEKAAAAEIQAEPGEQPPAPEAAEPTVAAKPRPTPAAAEKSFFESLTDNWLFLLSAAALLLAGGLGYGYVRRRREADVDEALKGFEIPSTAPVPTETMRLRSLAAGAGAAAATPEAGLDIVVEERPAPRARPGTARPAAPDETISAEAALDLDQADPLAEADFHMAYGLYDQASDLVRMALQQSPERNDLKLKLAEIHFVAGDTAQFLAVVRDLHQSLGAGADWDRIVIMGRQLAPEDALFAGGVRSSGVDLSLEGGDSRVDLDLLSAPAGEEGLDLDLGQVLAAGDDSDTTTGEETALEFNLDEGPPAPTTTLEVARRDGTSTVEIPTVEMPSAETPTVKSPVLDARGDETIREQVSTPPRPAASAESTAEMAIDDLGLDVGELEYLPGFDDATTETGQADEATRIAARDDVTRQMPQAGVPDDEETALLHGLDTEHTAMLPELESGAALTVDLDIGAAPAGREAEPTATERLPSDQIPQLAELEPVTLSEVGTKLDLARAYMDMGDPDGARNILQEVLAEGSASQRQEARRLIDSLPGA